jgi:hypothetical protein
MRCPQILREKTWSILYTVIALRMRNEKYLQKVNALRIKWKVPYDQEDFLSLVSVKNNITICSIPEHEFRIEDRGQPNMLVSLGGCG